jgi:Tfp pilus assembly protein PilN
MIKINLLLTKRKKKAKPLPMFLFAAVGLLAVSLVGSLYAASLVDNKIEALVKQKMDNKAEMVKLKEKMAEVEKFEGLNRAVQEKKKVIEDLSRNQGIPVIILQEVSRTLTDGIWILTMSISQNTVKISGVGFSNSDIVAYIQSLKGSGVFTGVRLHGTTRKAGKTKKGMPAMDTYTFDITFNVEA